MLQLTHIHSHTPHRIFIIFITLITLFIWPSSSLAEEPVIIIAQLSPQTDLAQLSSDYQVTILNQVDTLNLYRIQSNDPDLLNDLQANPDVITLQDDNLLHTFETEYQFEATMTFEQQYFDADGQTTTPKVLNEQQYFDADGDLTDPDYIKQWAITKLRLKQAHERVTGQGTIVAVIDTGIDLYHPVFQGKLTTGYDFVDNDSTPQEVAGGPGSGHGTHVAGIINLTAPQTKIMPIRVLNSQGIGYYFDVIAGIIYAVDHGADVINLSLSGPDDDPFLREAIDYAGDHGVVVVVAASAYDIRYPAFYDNVISVGATDEQDHVAEFSDFRAGQVSVFAPGISIYSTYYNHGYASWTGTSMATPFVAGEAALLLSTNMCERDCTITTIQEAVHPVVPSLELRGRVDVYDAVKAIVGP